MKISVDEIPQSPKEVKFSESIEELNEVYRRGDNRDIFFTGTFEGEFTGCCSRCLESYSFKLDKEFEFVLTPDPSTSDRRAEELHRDDLGLSYYAADEINLKPLIAEQVMLALPTRPLCSENCRGLCGNCGSNLNKETCSCAAERSDPRMAIFRTLKVGR
jgi:uncharacterized protein